MALPNEMPAPSPELRQTMSNRRIKADIHPVVTSNADNANSDNHNSTNAGNDDYSKGNAIT